MTSYLDMRCEDRGLAIGHNNRVENHDNHSKFSLIDIHVDTSCLSWSCSLTGRRNTTRATADHQSGPEATSKMLRFHVLFFNELSIYHLIYSFISLVTIRKKITDSEHP